MRSLFISSAAVAVAMLASPLAEAKSDIQCALEARRVTGEYDGLEFSEAKTACILDTRPRFEAQALIVIPDISDTPVVFTRSRRVASGIWMRVSPNRWVLRPH
jgi:hypothetical protein